MSFLERLQKKTDKSASPERNGALVSRFIVPPPSTLDGYQLQLTGNHPNSLTPHELHTSGRKINTFRLTQNGKGAWDAYKVNITQAHAITTSDEKGQHHVIQYEAAPATYFQLRAGIDRHTPKETGRKLSHAGVMVIAITGDENPQIILATRPDTVNLYPRTITATASGSWEGQPTTPVPTLPDGSTDYAHLPKLVPPTPNSVRGQMETELTEETGIPLRTIIASKITLLGIAEDSQKWHWDTLWMVELPAEMTKDKVRELHTRAKEINPHTNDPMAGHLIFIDANPEKIREYLTQLHTFWDGNADRALLAVGKMLLMKRLINQSVSPEDASQQATAWMTDVNREIKQKRQERDEEVKVYRRYMLRTAWQKRRRAWGDIAKNQLNLLNREPVRQARQSARRAAITIDEYGSRPKHYSPVVEPEPQIGSGVKDALQEIGYPLD